MKQVLLELCVCGSLYVVSVSIGMNLLKHATCVVFVSMYLYL